MAYVEIKGRQIRRTPTHAVYDCVGVAATAVDTGVPVCGDVLADPDLTHTLSAVAEGGVCDEITEPGRVLVRTRYKAPWTRAEAYD